MFKTSSSESSLSTVCIHNQLFKLYNSSRDFVKLCVLVYTLEQNVYILLMWQVDYWFNDYVHVGLFTSSTYIIWDMMHYYALFPHTMVYVTLVATAECIALHGVSVLLHWRHNDHDGVSNHQPHDCLLNRLLRRRSKKTSKLRVTGLCAGNSPGTVNSPHKWPVTRKCFHFMT